MARLYGISKLETRLSSSELITNNERKGLEGELLVLKVLEKHLNQSTVIIHDPLLQRYKADILIIDEHLGFMFVEVKNWNIKFIKNLDSNGTFTTLKSKQTPLKQTENYYKELNHILLSLFPSIDFHRFISTVVVFPSISKKDLSILPSFVKWTDLSKSNFFKTHLFSDDLVLNISLNLKESNRFKNKRLSTVIKNVEIEKVVGLLTYNHNQIKPVNSEEVRVSTTINLKKTKEFEDLIPIDNSKRLHQKSHLILLLASIAIVVIYPLTIINSIFEQDDHEYVNHENPHYAQEDSDLEDHDNTSVKVFNEDNTSDIKKIDTEEEEIKEITQEDLIINSESIDSKQYSPTNEDEFIIETPPSKFTTEFNSTPFTLGSTKEQVISSQGIPTETVTFLNQFRYELSSIDFNEHNIVIGWNNYSGNLNVTMVSDSINQTYTIGSTKDEVIAAQGTPKEIVNILNQFKYDLSSVSFDDEERVISWNNYSKNLHVIMKSDANVQNFTTGSSQAEVISSMGTPTSIIPILNQWSYGLSTIQFDTKQNVENWNNFEGNLKLR